MNTFKCIVYSLTLPAILVACIVIVPLLSAYVEHLGSKENQSCF